MHDDGNAQLVALTKPSEGFSSLVERVTLGGNQGQLRELESVSEGAHNFFDGFGLATRYLTYFMLDRFRSMVLNYSLTI